MKAFVKSTIREIKNSFGRYLAILIITALGVGFFSGLRACRPALTETAGVYFDTQNFYDYCLMSSLGFSKDSIEAFAEQPDIAAAEGSLYEDALVTMHESDLVFRIYAVPDSINKPQIKSGRMPENDRECVVDAGVFGEDIIGQTIRLSVHNSEDTLDAFTGTEFTVVGTVITPLYINVDRGTASLGDGKIVAVAFVDEACFTADYYKEVYLAIENRAEAYSDAYQEQIEAMEDDVRESAKIQAGLRYQEIVSDAQKEIDDAEAVLADAEEEMKAQKDAAIQEAAEQMTGMGLPASPENPYYAQMLEEVEAVFADVLKELDEKREELAEAQQEVDSMEEPSVYVLTRNENAGYAAFEQDSAIIENISVVFPVFFFLVAALVCVTTMTRMVDEQRTQIGVWKAMGYNKGRIACKYLFYAGSAGLLGSILGFFAGTVFIPVIFWIAYTTLYNFADRLLYVFDPVMYVLALGISLLCTAGVTMLCCWRTMREVTASILRPKAPKGGKRILLERFKIWSHIGFLRKVSLRNVVRYKQRFFLMILGISGCTALLLTGFGIRDSIQNVTDYQYSEITLYDAEVTFTDPVGTEWQEAFPAQYDAVESVLFLSGCSADITADGVTKSITITAVMNGGDISSFMDLHTADTPVSYPQDEAIILSRGIAEKLHAQVGDRVVLTSDSYRQITVTVTGVFDNYVENYAFVSENTMVQFCGEAPVNEAYVCFKEEEDMKRAAAVLLGDDNVSYVALIDDVRETIDTSFSSLNLVVLLIILCAGVLAFIVLFNLININIGERIREIATIKVLGFFSSETSDYVFREVNILTAAGALLGLLFGKLLHAFVMSQLRPDKLCFDSRISWSSYLFSLAITLGFSLIVKFAMQFKLKKISMAESLKTVE